MNFEKARFNMVEQQIRPLGGAGFRRARPADERPPRGVRAGGFSIRRWFSPEAEIPRWATASMLVPVIEGKILQAIQVKARQGA